jgi:hypothetical protein
LVDRHYQLNDFAEEARKSENKLISDLQGVKANKSKEVIKREKK